MVVLSDPKAFDFQHILQCLTESKQDMSAWPALILSTVDLKHVGADLVDQTLSRLEAAAIPWAQHQIPRIRLLSALKNKRYNAIDRLWNKCLQRMSDFNLVMERVRLFALYQYMQSNEIPLPETPMMLPHAILDRPETIAFISG